MTVSTFNLVVAVSGRSSFVPPWLCPVLEANTIKTWFDQAGVENSSGLHIALTSTLLKWDELEHWLKSYYPTSVPDLTNALLTEWAPFPPGHTLTFRDAQPAHLHVIVKCPKLLPILCICQFYIMENPSRLSDTIVCLHKTSTVGQSRKLWYIVKPYKIQLVCNHS